MKRITSLAFAVTLLGPFALAQDPAQDPSGLPDNSAKMKRLAWLVGTWEGKGEMPGYGKYTFQYKLAWTLSSNFLKQDYWMKVGDRTVWKDTGMLGYDKDAKKFMSFVFGMDGTIGHGGEIAPESIGIKPNQGKDVLVIDGQTTGNSPWKKFRTVMYQVDKNTIEIDTLVVQDGKWISMGKVTGHRADAGAQKGAEKKTRRKQESSAQRAP